MATARLPSAKASNGRSLQDIAMAVYGRSLQDARNNNSSGGGTTVTMAAGRKSDIAAATIPPPPATSTGDIGNGGAKRKRDDNSMLFEQQAKKRRFSSSEGKASSAVATSMDSRQNEASIVTAADVTARGSNLNQGLPSGTGSTASAKLFNRILNDILDVDEPNDEDVALFRIMNNPRSDPMYEQIKDLVDICASKGFGRRKTKRKIITFYGSLMPTP